MTKHLQTPDARLAVETYGQPGAPALLLIQGLSMQMTDWPQGLIMALARNHHVVIFDNRDSGLSEKFGPDWDPGTAPHVECLWRRLPIPPIYSLQDMARDAVSIADLLGIRRFSLIGFSMGGMIAQIIAERHPDRVQTLISLMSSDGRATLNPQPAAGIAMKRAMLNQGGLKDNIDRLAADNRLYQGPGNLWASGAAALAARRAVLRSHCPTGTFRQACAILGSGDRRGLLGRIEAPSLVIHGSEDPCIPAEQARNAANRISGSEMVELPAMGHDLCPRAVSLILRLIERHLRENQAEHANVRKL